MTASQPVSESARQRLRVLIAGGGTGGHVIPALAIARELRDAHGDRTEIVLPEVTILSDGLTAADRQRFE